jgi:D-3-phosphoglycerate dehydrogenase
MERMPPKIVVADQKASELSIEMDVLTALDASVEKSSATSEAEVIRDGADANGLIVDGYTPVTETVLNKLSDLCIVARAGIGVDNIDVEAATHSNVLVVNVPDVSFGNVATHTFALLLSCIRKIPQYDARVRAGSWNWEDEKPLNSLSDKTLGIVGFGNVARSLVAKLDGLDVDIIAYDHSSSPETLASYGVEKVSFETLLKRADYHSIHVPLTEETAGLYDRAAFNKIRSGAIIVNTARGGIMDEDALHMALEEGCVAGAGLDVLSSEPPNGSPLLDSDKVVFTPHIAWYSEETIEQLRRNAAMEVARILSGEQPENPVNEISLESALERAD